MKLKIPASILTISLLFAGTLFGNPGLKISKYLENVDKNETVSVIVRLDRDFDKKSMGMVRAAILREMRNYGAQMMRNLDLINGFQVEIKAKHLARIAGNIAVEYITPNRTLTSTLEKAVPTTGANIVHDYGWDGDGIGVAIIDSGVGGAWPAGQVVYRESFVGGTEPDDYGHGTHVAGIVGYRAVDSNDDPGLAPGVSIIDLRVLDENGAGTDAGVIAAIERAVELKDQYNIRVVNLSLGRPVFESFDVDPLSLAAEEAWHAGIVVVAAAGNMGRDNSFKNRGYGTINSPGNNPFVLTVGATRMRFGTSPVDDRVTSYSSKGPTLIDHIVKPDIVAPGNRIVAMLSPNSKLATDHPGNKVQKPGKPEKFRLSGTSMAAPMVSAAVAMLLEKEPALTPDQVKARLMLTAQTITPRSSWWSRCFVTGTQYSNEYDVFTVGAGYLDIWAALNEVETAPADTFAASPVAEFDEATGEVYLVTDDSILWGRSIIWGRSVIWGRSTLWGAASVWSDAALVEDNSIIWGRSVLWGRSMLWGTQMNEAQSVIWGRNSPHDTSIIWGRSVDALNAVIGGDEEEE